MSRATPTTRIKHTCHYGRACAACAANPVRVRVPHDAQLAERISKFRGKACVSNSLPKHTPGADAYTADGKPVFTSLRSQEEAGKRFGLHMV